MTPPSGTTSYEELTTPADMDADCRAVGHQLRLAAAARKVARPAPSLHFDEQPGERGKPGIEVSEAAARLAAAIYGV